MKENLTNGTAWNEAAKAGLLFGAISSAYVGISELLTLIGSPVLQGFLKTVFWAGKLGLCIWLMVFLMKKFAGKYCIFDGGVEADLLDDPHTFAGDFEGDEPLLAFGPEPLGLEVEVEVTLCAEFGVGDVVSDHPLPAGYLTNL